MEVSMDPTPRLALAGAVLAASLVLVAEGATGTPAHPHGPVAPVTSTSPTVSPEPSTAPVPGLARLRIPSIGVDAPIDDVGVTPQGDLATPTDPTHVGWYDAGSLPGRPGSSVIDGHLDWYTGPGVFANLARLRPSDPLEVTYSDGSAAAFEVSTMAIYPADRRPPAELFRADGPPQLVLITCAGSWDGARYLDRLVVTAERADAGKPLPTPRATNGGAERAPRRIP
jgi:sortase (surface protein transpeptidase)